MIFKSKCFIVCLVVLLGSSSFAKQTERQRKITALESQRDQLRQRTELLKRELETVAQRRLSLERMANDLERKKDEEERIFDPRALDQEALSEARQFIANKVSSCNGKSYMLATVTPAVNRSITLYFLMEFPTPRIQPIAEGVASSQGNWEGKLIIPKSTFNVYGWTNSTGSRNKKSETKTEIVDFSMKRMGGLYADRSTTLIGGRWEIRPTADNPKNAWIARDMKIEDAVSCDNIAKIFQPNNRGVIR